MQLFMENRVQAHGEILGFKKGEADLESAPVGNYNHDVDENYGADENVENEKVDDDALPRYVIVRNDGAPLFSGNDIVCILARKCDHTGKARTMPPKCRDKEMISAIGRVCSSHLAGQVSDPRFEEKLSPKRSQSSGNDFNNPWTFTCLCL